MMKTLAFVTCLVAFPTMIMLSIIYQHHMFDLIGEFSKVKFLGVGSEHDSSSTNGSGISNYELISGLLASGFDQESCLSRYQSVLYRKTSAHKPSPFLLYKLRKYRSLHKRCGPCTESYNRTLKMLGDKNISSPAECNYMVWTALEGLGNRISNMASGFLYALLTNRVFLVEQESDMSDLFCNPFPNTSWSLPQEFPFRKEFRRLNLQFPDKYGNMVRNSIINASTVSVSPPSLLYLFLAFNSDDYDKLFYCAKHQELLQKVPWLILKSDQYFIPFLFLNPSFEQELDMRFPDKETAFHFLEFYENMKNMYWTFPTVTGEVIGVYQPSHKQYQHFGDNMPNAKAWVELYLLSMSDVLATISWSIFGYVAQGLDDLKPWMLCKPENWKTPNLACQRPMSMEPCYHFPSTYDCKTKVKDDTGAVVPHIMHCEDEPAGLKLDNNYNRSGYKLLIHL